MSRGVRLRYFDLRGRAELIRLIYAYGGKSLEEVTVPMSREFIALKPSLPFKQLPVLDIDGKTYSQSIALARYAAKQHGLYPRDDDVAALEVDMLADSIDESIVTPIIRWCFQERNEDVKAKQIQRLQDKTLPTVLSGLHDRVQGKFFLGDTVSMADISFYNAHANFLLPWADTLPIGWTQFPKLTHLSAAVARLPLIAKYAAQRRPSKI
ncbi:TPA: hypothetical protein N0F65_010727 [Lagenidium giganteum]|uniref:Glutathione S-transferase n=1 Tax=Lagenidium giganteum TaxID=4803 RepID=A0AAV2YI40_9STRA|nr:TPA: hypothetical protein N0F65_010727 [Lagenidium giganteum]